MSSNVEVVPRVSRDRMEATNGRACRSATAVPPLRFKGFDGAWNENTIGGCFDLSVSNNTLSRACLADFGSVRNVHYGDVLIRLSDVTDVKNSFLPFVADEQFKVTTKNALRNGDIVMADTAEDEAVGKVTEIRGVGNFTVVSGLHTIALRPNVPFGDGFLGVYMNSSAFHDGLRQIMQGVKVLSVSKGALADVGMRYPLETEQRKIGASFRQIDALIAARAKALGKLTNLKKAMLEKMFPRAGAKVPEVRFKGFDGEWEERRLGDLVFRVTRKNSNLESDLPLTVSAECGLVDQRTFFNSRIASKNVSNYFLLKKGEFAYNKSSSDGYPYGTVKRLDLYPMGVLSTLYIVFAINSEDVDSEYLVHFYSTKLWHYDVSLRAAEGARNHGLLNIAPSDFFDTSIILPRDISEQRRIGAYFRSLDALIAARREEVGKLKDLKKALLDRMFV